jgi:hypothetical protein
MCSDVLTSLRGIRSKEIDDYWFDWRFKLIMPAKKTATKTAATTTTTPSAKAEKLHAENAEAQLEQRQAGAEMEDKGIRAVTPTGAPPPVPKGKEETRLFEVEPGNKVWLTESEAADRRLFWRKDVTDTSKKDIGHR